VKSLFGGQEFCTKRLRGNVCIPLPGLLAERRSTSMTW